MRWFSACSASLIIPLQIPDNVGVEVVTPLEPNFEELVLFSGSLTVRIQFGCRFSCIVRRIFYWRVLEIMTKCLNHHFFFTITTFRNNHMACGSFRCISGCLMDHCSSLITEFFVFATKPFHIKQNKYNNRLDETNTNFVFVLSNKGARCYSDSTSWSFLCI